jgi:predicted acetyltransferase
MQKKLKLVLPNKKYNKKTTRKRNGINIPKGKVPATLYWAVE